MRIALPRSGLGISLGWLIISCCFAWSPLTQLISGIKKDSFAFEMCVAVLAFGGTASLLLYVLPSTYSLFLWRESKKFRVELQEGEGITIGPLLGLQGKCVFLEAFGRLPESLMIAVPFLIIKALPRDPIIQYEIKVLGKTENTVSEISHSVFQEVAFSPKHDNSEKGDFWSQEVKAEGSEYFLQIKVVKILVPGPEGKRKEDEKKLRDTGKLKVKLEGKLRVSLRAKDAFNVKAVDIRHSQVQFQDKAQSATRPIEIKQ